MRTHVQWKGTSVCLDFTCDCGVNSHVDAEFAYFIQCPACRKVYKLGTEVSATETTEPDMEPVEGFTF
jgi:hypothetical protein